MLTPESLPKCATVSSSVDRATGEKLKENSQYPITDIVKGQM